ncbi:MAG TPA: lamin tail domain-containing protein, partial [Symbiobacteriaceae bacterium]|nr:lamin tail domain-containing protein [Symbiobacteriaceae bacterium]
GLAKIHNKGFIIDGQKVLVSSINGSENSASENREAALLIENANVAEFYRDAWHWLWNQGKNDAGVAQPLKNPVLSEVMFDPPGTETAEEWAEIYNPTATAINLTGWKLQDNSGVWSFPAGTTLAAGATMTVARDAAGYQALYGTAPAISGLTLSLANTADYVLLVDPKGNTISKVAWGGAKPNWGLTAAQNTTLERCPVTRDRFTAIDWTPGATPTPGFVPTSCGGTGGGSTATHVVISEVFYDTPGNDDTEEWVELYNPTASAVAIGGWKLTDDAGTFTIPAGTTLAAGSYLTVARQAKGFKALYGTVPNIAGLTLALGNTGDVVYLKDAAGSEIDKVAYEGYQAGWTVSAATGDSIHRCPVTTDTDTNADWTVKATETPGAGCN